MGPGEHDDVAQANMPLHISTGTWTLLCGYMAVLVITILRSYFGGFREQWRGKEGAAPGEKGVGLSTLEMGQMMLWRGEMNHGASSVVLLWVVLPALHTGMMNPLGFDILFAFQAAWLGARFVCMGPAVVALLSLLLEPRMWLTVGLVVTCWDSASWQAQAAFVFFPAYGLLVNNFQFPQQVFGVRGWCAWCSPDWNFERYRVAARKVRDPAVQTRFERCRARLPTYVERERVICTMLERFRQLSPLGVEELPRRISTRTRYRLCAVLVPAMVAVPVVAFAYVVGRTKQRWRLHRGSCDADTGGSCGIFGCDSWRNAICNRTLWSLWHPCVCDEGLCAVDGICVPEPPALQRSAGAARGGAGGRGAAGPGRREKTRALVFSGGGAKGAWEIGILQALCEQNTSANAAFGSSWSMLVGTSIGAMNAGFLAQFPEHEQCSRGLPAALKYWNAIVQQEDVFESPSPWHFESYDHISCFRVSEAPNLFGAFSARGGLCNPAPGATTYQFEVDPARVRSSGMRLWVVATSLNTSQPRWWNESSDDVLDGVLASGALAPLLFPKVVAREWFIDGGLIANTPVLKAVEEGAEEILVMMLSPLKVPELQAMTPLGLAIFEFEFDLMIFKYFVEFELVRACQVGEKRGARIWGYAPSRPLESFIAFEAAKIEAMRLLGYELARNTTPFDLCAWMRRMHSGVEGHSPAALGATPPPCPSADRAPATRAPAALLAGLLGVAGLSAGIVVGLLSGAVLEAAAAADSAGAEGAAPERPQLSAGDAAGAAAGAAGAARGADGAGERRGGGGAWHGPQRSPWPGGAGLRAPLLSGPSA